MSIRYTTDTSEKMIELEKFVETLHFKKNIHKVEDTIAGPVVTVKHSSGTRYNKEGLNNLSMGDDCVRLVYMDYTLVISNPKQMTGGIYFTAS